MKQVIQNLSSGITKVKEIPRPQVKEGSLLIQTKSSLVSSGTERTLIQFGKGNYLQKAYQQPEKVKKVLDKLMTDGIYPTIDAVKSKLTEPISLGYCNAGEVIESLAEGFKVGDRVISNGSHAEVVRVEKNLCCKIPDNVDFDSASFTVLGAVGLQGIRLTKPSLGESIVVIGLGVIGLLIVQMLITNGCRVLAVDRNSNRCDIAKKFGAEIVDLSKNDDLLEHSKSFTLNLGADAVIIAASSKDDKIIHQAADISRKRGRIILVGTVGLNLRREDFYEKELTFQVSSSYGPGRYDKNYEELGFDYPIGFVRWTQQRNFEAVLNMMSTGKLDVKPLITHYHQIEEASEAYKLLDDPRAIGIVLNYSSDVSQSQKDSIVELSEADEVQYSSSDVVIGLLGAGNYASRVMIPALQRSNVKLDTIVSSTGISAVNNGNKASFNRASTDISDILENHSINTVFIATRHNLHAEQVIQSLEAGKNVFVEKPLAISLDELDEIRDTFERVNSQKKEHIKLMVGFNRRFSPHINQIKELLSKRSEQVSTIITVNAGYLASDHWTQDRKIGGGRIIGEACHFVDLISYINDSQISSFSVKTFDSSTSSHTSPDTASISVSLENGSFGNIHYFSNGGGSFPKERIEIFCGQSTLQLDNFRILRGYNWPKFRKNKSFSQDKGHKACLKAFIESIKSGDITPIPFEEIYQSSKATIEIASKLDTNN